MSRKQLKRRAGNMVYRAIASVFILAVVCGVGFSVASADSSDDLVQAGAFGFDEATQSATSAAQALLVEGESKASDKAGQSASATESDTSGQSVLATASVRSLDANLKMIEDKKQAERERKAAEERAARERARAENEAALERVRAQREMQGVSSLPVYLVEEEPEEAAVGQDDSAKDDKADDEAKESSDSGAKDDPDSEDRAEVTTQEMRPVEHDYEYDLPAVDWTVGREAFVSEWTARIDAYLAGSALDGYGYAFAEAAWENGVDPRWSPAISNTESGKGSVCFLPCNAWGWGDRSWDDWDSAIRDHVAGLATGYGYSITRAAAEVYCPPNCDYWYSTTIGEMASI